LFHNLASFKYYDSAVLHRGTAALGKRDFDDGTSVFGPTKKILEGATMPLGTVFQRLLKKVPAELLVNVLKVRIVKLRYNMNFPSSFIHVST
jgi:hypothetical protein